MREEWVLAAAVALATLVAALGVVRWLAPQLLGVPADLQLAQVSREVAPLFDPVFRDDDYETDDFLLTPPADCASLVAAERANLERLAGEVAAVPGAIYIDVLAPLQAAALRSTPLYPANTNEHPVAAGYAAIGEAVAERVRDLVEGEDNDEVESGLLFRRAHALQRYGRPDDAIPVYEGLLARNAGHRQGTLNLGYALVARSAADLRRAVVLFEEMTKSAPDCTAALFRLGEAYRLSGNRAGAIEAYRRFNAAGGNAGLRAEAQQRLTELGAKP